MPLRVIWRSVRRSSSPFLWLPIFCVFVCRKLTGRRLVADFATARRDELPEVSHDAIPDEVLAAMQPFVVECEAADFQHVAYMKLTDLGRKINYAEVLLHSSGYSYASVIWTRVSIGKSSRTQSVMECCSYCTNGDRLSTCAVRMIPYDMLSRDYHICNLGPNAKPRDITQAHFRRIDDNDLLIRFDTSSLRRHLLATHQSLVDFQIGRGYLRPLSSAEFERLMQQADTE
jgi:hypothetical protein